MTLSENREEFRGKNPGCNQDNYATLTKYGYGRQNDTNNHAKNGAVIDSITGMPRLVVSQVV